MTGKTASVAVRTAIDVGYRHIDTAAMYKNEADVGKGIKQSGIDRGELFLTTKVWPDQLSRDNLRRSAANSCKLLGVNQVDLLLIHWPSSSMTAAEMIENLNLAKSEGYARHIGVSNFPSKLLDEAWKTTTHPLVVNQCEYHPELDQQTVLAACRRHNMGFVSYRPLSRGAAAAHPAVQGLVAKYGKSFSQVILRWHIQQPNVIAIPKSATPTRIQENFNIFDFELTDDEMATLHQMAKPDGRTCDFDFSPDWD